MDYNSCYTRNYPVQCPIFSTDMEEDDPRYAAALREWSAAKGVKTRAKNAVKAKEDEIKQADKE